MKRTGQNLETARRWLGQGCGGGAQGQFAFNALLGISAHHPVFVSVQEFPPCCDVIAFKSKVRSSNPAPWRRLCTFCEGMQQLVCSLVIFTCTVLIGRIFIFVISSHYIRTCVTHRENHRTHSEYQNHLILKVFSFRWCQSLSCIPIQRQQSQLISIRVFVCLRFVNVFSSLYYYAFSHSMLNLAVQLAAFMLLGQVLERNHSE